MSCKIYCIEDCNGLKYVGSTTQTLKSRLISHKGGKKFGKNTSSKKLDLDNCKIYQLEECDISHRYEREKYWINNTHCVNERKMNFNQKEYERKWYLENRQKQKQKQKQYYLKNNEKRLEQMKQYQQKNREKIKEQKKEYYINKKIALFLETLNQF